MCIYFWKILKYLEMWELLILKAFEESASGLNFLKGCLNPAFKDNISVLSHSLPLTVWLKLASVQSPSQSPAHTQRTQLHHYRFNKPNGHGMLVSSDRHLMSAGQDHAQQLQWELLQDHGQHPQYTRTMDSINSISTIVKLPASQLKPIWLSSLYFLLLKCKWDL